MDQAGLLRELEPTLARLFDRHLAATREWFPHEHVPYHRARDFAPGEAWQPEHTDAGGAVLSEAARGALFLTVPTEHTLPYYFHDIERMFGGNGTWGAWAR